MVNHARYADFLADKQGFFSGVATADGASARVRDKNYTFLANNHLLIKQEFDQMFKSLQKQGQNRREFWLYCYYCCEMLQSYYTSYGKQIEVDIYAKKAAELLHRAETGRFANPQINEAGFVDSLRIQLAADLAELARTPRHISEIEKWLGFTNIYRIHFTFCRIFVKQSIIFARELEWLKQLQALAGSNADDMVAAINAPAQVFYSLSVGLMAARFIINAGMLLKHTFFAAEHERDLAWQERFKKELYKRHCVMLNDMVWGTVNLLTNYPTILNVSAPLAAWLTAGFMCFDIALLVYRRHLNEQEYLLKKAQFSMEKTNYLALLQAMELSAADRQKYVAHISVLDEQLKQLEISHKASDATFLFNIVAATLLMSGFTASLLVTAPVAITVFYLVCTIGVAMYLTADIYGAYKEKSLILEQLQIEHGDTTEAFKAMQKARNDFMLAMAKNIIIPLLIVTLFAVSWQAALVFVAVYVGFELLNGCRKKAQQQRPNQLPAPQGAVVEAEAEVVAPQAAANDDEAVALLGHAAAP